MLIDVISLILIAYMGIITSVQDIRYNKIKNKTILKFLIISIVLIVSRIILTKNINWTYFSETFLNILISLFMGFLFWELNLWNAGDAKLFVVYAALIPLNFYRIGYINHFPSFMLIINTFTPLFVFYALKLLLKVGLHSIWTEVRNALKPNKLISLISFVFGFSWVLKLALQTVGLGGFPYTTIIALIAVQILFEKFKFKKEKISTALCILRFFVDSNILQLSFVFEILKLISVMLIFNIAKKLSKKAFTKRVTVSELKPGMTRVDNNIILDKEDIKKIHKPITVFETLPFAPLLFSGVILTIIFKGNVILVIRIILERFI